MISMPSKVFHQLYYIPYIPSKKTSNTYRELLQTKKRGFGGGSVLAHWSGPIAPGTKNIDQRDAGGLEFF